MEQNDASKTSHVPVQVASNPEPSAMGKPVQPAADVAQKRWKKKKSKFSPWVLNTGFLSALILAGICLLGAVYYLYRFQTEMHDVVLAVLRIPNSVEVNLSEKQIAARSDYQHQLAQIALGGQMYVARIQLLSCGIFIGLAFGFLGFALFLLGIEGAMDAKGEHGSLSFKVVSISPGVFVLLCSTILIGICATMDLPTGFTQVKEQTDANDRESANKQGSNTGNASAAAANEDTTNAKKPKFSEADHQPM
jgi:hypothetical protein